MSTPRAMLGRCAAVRKLGFEHLEERSLLSIAPPLGSLQPEVSGGPRPVAEIAPSTADGEEGRITLTHTTDSGLTDQTRTDRTGDGKDSGTSTAARSDPDGSGASRRSASQIHAPRELVESIQPELRNSIDSASSTDTTDNAPDGEPEATSGLAGDALQDSAGSVVGWATGAALTAGISLASSPGRFVGLEDRMGGSQVGPGVVAALVSGSEIHGLAPSDTQTAPVHDAGEPTQLPLAATSDREAPAWGDLVEGALHPDWDALDGELRRLLARLGGLAHGPDDHSAWPSWAFWIGAATAMILARRALHGPRRLFRRPILRQGRARIRLTGPVGPWPLGSP